MTNSKSTKRALLTSSVSLLLCFAMLLGTTFAWFTDSVASANNIIKAGNLDIEVQYTLGDKDTSGELVWKDLGGATDLFQKGLWEPGHTEVVALRIKNNGTLTLKYAANMNIVSEKVGKTKDGADIVLSDILTVSTLVQQANQFGDIALEMAFEKDSYNGYENTTTFKAGNVFRNDVELQPNDTHYMIVKVDMAETVGNEANYTGTDIPTINFGINVLATQFTYENDSFGNQYDKDSEYLMERKLTLDEDSTESVKIEANESVEFDLNNNALNSNIVNNGAINIEDGTINIDAAGLENYGEATLTNVTMNAGSSADYSNICNAGSTTIYNNVDINSAGGGIGAVNGAKVIFNSSSVAVNSASTSGRYNFYAVGNGTEITINGGNFSFSKTLNQKRAYIYAGSGATVYVTGGTFGPASTRSGYTAGILGDGTVIITGGTFRFNPTAWVADGYVATESNGIWTVTAAN